MPRSVLAAKRLPIGARPLGLVVAAAVGVLVLVAGVASAEPFAGERFAPVSETVDSAALAVRAITVDDGASVGLTFTVTLDEAFSPPPDGYRIGVSVGDPTGRRTRWSALVEGGQVVGTVETGDGTQWGAAGSTTATLDSEAGRATIDADPPEIAPASALWVDVELPTPLGAVVSGSTYFSYDSLVQPLTAPTIAGTAWGWIRDASGARIPGAERLPGAPPSAAIVNRALVMSSLEAPPAFLAGQPVTAASDAVRFLDATATGSGDGGYVVVDRVTGVVQLFRVQGGTTTEVPDAAETIAPSTAPGAAPSTDPPGTRTVSIDLAAVERELGLPSDASSVAIAVDRDLTLADGSLVSASGVAATVALLEASGPQPPVEATPAGDAVEVDESSDGIPTALVVAVGVLALLVIGAVVASLLFTRRRRQRQRSLLDEGWFEREPTKPASPPPPIAAGAAAAPDTTDADAEAEPVLDLSDRAKPAMVDVADGNGNGHGSGNGVTASEVDARASQARALEELEAQFADLMQRVDRLGSDHEPL